MRQRGASTCVLPLFVIGLARKSLGTKAGTPHSRPHGSVVRCRISKPRPKPTACGRCGGGRVASALSLSRSTVEARWCQGSDRRRSRRLGLFLPRRRIAQEHIEVDGPLQIAERFRSAVLSTSLSNPISRCAKNETRAASIRVESTLGRGLREILVSVRETGLETMEVVSSRSYHRLGPRRKDCSTSASVRP